MQFKRLLNTPFGVVLISILLGFGISCLFRRVCTEGSCINFKGAVIDTIHNKIYQHNEKCFTYSARSTTCKPDLKKIVDVSDPIIAD